MNNQHSFAASARAIFFLAMCVVACGFCKPTTVMAAQTLSSMRSHGKIVVDEGFFDFGIVTEGDIVRHTFKLRNDGKESVKILKTETSCGCTTTNGALKVFAPGEAGEMEVVVDTKGKKGIIVKSVKVLLDNDEAESIEFSLTMKLVPPPHPKIENIRNINAEAACKGCHLESGAGQFGIFLYHRVCAQCHGKKGGGGMARALNDKAAQQLGSDLVETVIRAGRPEAGMPPFVQGVTPPLTDEQVGSLVQYIRGLSR